MPSPRVSRLAWLLFCCGGVCVVAGCFRYVEDKWSRARPLTYPVRGTVQYDGRSVSGAVVTFMGRSTSGADLAAVGLTDANGRFELKTYRPGDGAISGSHRVAIEKRSLGGGEPDTGKPFESQQEYEAQRAAGAGPPKLARELPAKYGSFETSGLTAEVSDKGPNEFIFQLEGAGPEAKGQASRP